MGSLEDDFDFGPKQSLTPSQWADRYRALGWQVVPQRQKHPIPAWGEFQNALVPQARYDDWYGEKGGYRNSYDMGVICGRCSHNMLAIDLDIHKTQAAADWWSLVLAENTKGYEPQTVEAKTGGGGRHLFFYAPDDYRVPTNKTGIGVDIRGQGGFVVLPPSSHQTGSQYAWVRGRAPWECEIAPAPQWLLDAVDDLVGAHGGDQSGKSRERTAQPEAERDGFGNLINGREKFMSEVVYHAVLEIRRKGGPIAPVGAEDEALCKAAYVEHYERHVNTRLPDDGTSKADRLDRECRGYIEFRRKWRSTMRKWGTPEFAAAASKPHPEEQPRASEAPKEEPETDPAGLIPLKSAFPTRGAGIPVRDWIVPGLLLKRALSMLVAPPGNGKSLLTLQLGTAVALGVEWGGWKPRKPERVLVINTEDDADEHERRLEAVSRIMGVRQADLADKMLLPGSLTNIVIAQRDPKTKMIIRTPLIERLIATIMHHGIGFVVVDPFAETYDVAENDNSEIKWAAALWREVARRTGCSLLLVHHTRKFASNLAGEADAARGGGAMIGIARSIFTLFNMTEDEANAMEIDVEERTSFVRFDDGKGNYSKRGTVRWFEKKSITLDNATGFAPADEVGVLVPWEPPDALGGASTADLNRVLDIIDRGIEIKEGKRYYTATKAGRGKAHWCGNVLMDEIEVSEKVAKKLIREWLSNRVLEVFEYEDLKQRKPANGVRSVSKNRPGKAEFTT